MKLQVETGFVNALLRFIDQVMIIQEDKQTYHNVDTTWQRTSKAQPALPRE